MGAEDEDPLDIAGAARTGDEGDHRWPVLPVEFGDERERVREVADQLFTSGQHHVVRRQDRQGPSPGGPAGDHQRSRLGDQGVAERDADIVRSIKSLVTINDKPVDDFWKGLDDSSGPK